MTRSFWCGSQCPRNVRLTAIRATDASRALGRIGLEWPSPSLEVGPAVSGGKRGEHVTRLGKKVRGGTPVPGGLLLGVGGEGGRGRAPSGSATGWYRSPACSRACSRRCCLCTGCQPRRARTSACDCALPRPGRGQRRSGPAGFHERGSASEGSSSCGSPWKKPDYSEWSMEAALLRATSMGASAARTLRTPSSKMAA